MLFELFDKLRGIISHMAPCHSSENPNSYAYRSMNFCLTSIGMSHFGMCHHPELLTLEHGLYRNAPGGALTMRINCRGSDLVGLSWQEMRSLLHHVGQVK
jgi:hypothetical protein